MEMKRILLAMSLLISVIATAQVGINTDNPTNSLDVNGDVRVRTLADAGNQDLVVASSASGVLNKTTVTVETLNNAMGDPEFNGVTVKKNQYFATMADPGKYIDAGVVSVRLYPIGGISTTDVYPQLALLEAPTSNVQVIVLDDETWNSGGTQGSAQILTFTTSNWNTYQSVGNGSMSVNEKNILTFSVPGTADLYRVTCYVVQNSSTVGKERLYNLIVEKF